MRIRKRKIPEINSSSSADIAFLLLIFFLITTSMDPEKGIYRRLPPAVSKEAVREKMDVRERNLMTISIDADNTVSCNDEKTDIRELKPLAKEFIANPDDEPFLPEKVSEEFEGIGTVSYTKNHVIVLRINDNSDYQTYISVQNELIAAYDELRNEFSQKAFKESFQNMNDEKKEIVRKIFPQKIAEQEGGGETP